MYLEMCLDLSNLERHLDTMYLEIYLGSLYLERHPGSMYLEDIQILSIWLGRLISKLQRLSEKLIVSFSS
jgi:hypothetical protein